MKYIRFNHPVLNFIVWQKETDLWHSKMARLAASLDHGNPISAGFVYWSETAEKFVCHGMSESLGLSSLPEDTDLFNKWIKGL
jgi:hypothetical protein